MPRTGLNSHFESNGVALPLISQAFSCDVSEGGVLTPEQTTKLSRPFLQAIRTSRVLTVVSKNYAFLLPPILYPPLFSYSPLCLAWSMTHLDQKRWMLVPLQGERQREREIRCHGNKRKVHVGQIPMGTVSWCCWVAETLWGTVCI